jgi:FSR family fosmidomycin resistance protein-like MFS transporter
MSFFMVGGESARTIGPLIIMSFLTYFALNQIWLLLPLAIICSCWLFFQLRTTDDAHLVHHKSISMQESFKILFSEKKLVTTILAVSLCKGFTASTLAALLSTFMKEQGVSNFLSGSSLSLFALAGLLGVSISGKLSDIIGREKTIWGYLVLAPLALLLFSFSHSTWLPATLFLVGLIATSITPVTMTYVQEIGRDIPSFANGIYMSANFMLTSLIVLLNGKFADLWGIQHALFISALLAFGGLLSLLLSSNRKSHRE